MIEITITKNESGQRLNKYLMKYLNKAPSSFIYKMLRKKNIKLNSIKALGDEMLVEGDVVKLFLSDETIENFREDSKSAGNVPSEKDKKCLENLKILYKTTDYIAVHKPVGILSQMATKTDYSINEAIIDYCLNNGILQVSELKTFKPSVCNRLDRNTSGIILAGISLKGTQYISESLKNNKIDKYYLSIVKGKIREKLICKGYIKKDSEINKSEIISTNKYLSLDNKDDYQPVETHFELIDYNNDYSLIRIKLVTGKSHQIRAHLNYLGYPVVGDNKYGDINTNRLFRDKYKLKHHLLHSGIVILPDKTKVYDELPDVFINICKDKGLRYELWQRGMEEV